MDISALGGKNGRGAEGERFDGMCDFCHKKGHKKKELGIQEGLQKGAGKVVSKTAVRTLADLRNVICVA